MKTFDRIFAAVIFLIIAVFIAANIMINSEAGDGRPYRVEIQRAALLIENGTLSENYLSGCSYITGIVKYSDSPDSFYKSVSDNVIREIKGELYRFDYSALSADKDSNALILNVTLAVMAAVIIFVMLYIRFRILKPFNRLTNVPYELSKGNLTAPVKETKNRFFGRFMWGIDLLRENMEEQKKRELELHKEKKTLLMSLSHDIKTPLSAIKLYSKALSRGLYTEKEKQLEIAESINAKADEIESYISQIIKASSEDFLQLEVEKGEFYLSELMNRISAYYKEKLQLIHTDLIVSDFSDCIISGDAERSVEVLQNIIENAIKYGSGESVEILFREEDDCQLVTVRNSGNTLPEKEMLHIFDSFYRGSNADGKSGSGLGLYICRQLMRNMNGDIFAESEADFMNITCVFQKA